MVDDFAHNPAKIAAAVAAARGLSERIIAVYQPHGFGPTRFLKNEYIATFRTIFRQNDSLYLLPIYYAGRHCHKGYILGGYHNRPRSRAISVPRQSATAMSCWSN